MTPDDHVHHGTDVLDDSQPPPPAPRPAPLLENATATIYLDGLIYAAYNEGSKVLESAILTKAEGHELVVNVKLRRNGELIWTKTPDNWNKDHEEVEKRAPFWLYVDCGKQLDKNAFSATLHSDDDDRSFNRIFDFDDFHHRPLRVKPGTFALFNFPHGKSYSADTTKVEVKRIPPRGEVADAQLEKEGFPISNLAAIDIDAVSNGDEKKYIVLANEKGDVFFSEALVQGDHYEISIENRPKSNSDTHDPKKHFLQFYELFDVTPKDPQFLVVDPAHDHESDHVPAGEGAVIGLHPPTADNPPCAPGRSGGLGGLSGGG